MKPAACACLVLLISLGVHDAAAGALGKIKFRRHQFLFVITTPYYDSIVGLLFLYRHFFELGIKSVVVEASRILGRRRVRLPLPHLPRKALAVEYAHD